MKNKSESVRKKKSKVSKSNTNRTNQTKRLYTNLGENNLGKY